MTKSVGDLFASAHHHYGHGGSGGAGFVFYRDGEGFGFYCCRKRGIDYGGAAVGVGLAVALITCLPSVVLARWSAVKL